MDEFYTMLNRTVLGQTIETKWTQENRTDLTDEDILLISESKTGYYSVAGPMRLGAILADASKQQLNKIYHLGKLLGFCFQIKDDLLDLTSDFSGMKKQIGNDICEGKGTIMLMHLFRTVKGKDKSKLTAVMGKSRADKSPKEVIWVIEMMEQFGSLAYGQRLIEKFTKQARDFFNQEMSFLSQHPARDQIKAFIDFISQRKY